MKNKLNYKGLSLIIVSLFTVLLFFSCAKERPDDMLPDQDVEKPEVTFNQTILTLYSIGSSVIIDVTATDNDALSKLSVKVTNLSNDSIYLHLMEIAPAAEISVLDTAVVNITNAMADFQVMVEAEDVSGNITKATKNFHVMN